MNRNKKKILTGLMLFVAEMRNCTEDQFACKSRNGECVPLGWVCDFNADCMDGSDEDGCSE